MNGIQCHVMSCLVLNGGATQGRGGSGVRKFIMARGNDGHWAVRVALCIPLFVLCILLISIIVVTVRFLCCSDKLPLSRFISFGCFFPFSSRPQCGEVQYTDCVALCCCPGPTMTVFIWHPRCSGNNSRTEQSV